MSADFSQFYYIDLEEETIQNEKDLRVMFKLCKFNNIFCAWVG